MKKSVISMLLALLAVGGTVLSSCGDAGEDVSKTTENGQKETVPADTEAVTEEPSALEKLPAEDYNGYEFHILHENQDDRQMDITTVGEENGDTMNDLVYRRNVAVEEKYNIKFVSDDTDMGKVNETLQKDVTAGLTSYDLYFQNRTLVPLASGGYLYVLNDLPNLDLSNEWWDKDALSGLSIANKTYFATGDISPTNLMTSSCIVFNKRLFQNNDMEFPYQAVKNDTWTLDRLVEMTKGLSNDVNGDGKYMYGDDIFGYTSWSFDSPYALFYGAGGMLTEKGSDDIPAIRYDMDKITSIFEKMYQLVVENDSYYVTDVAIVKQAYENFANGNAYMSDTTFEKINTFLRDMKDDFGIVPYPKYDASQTSYAACVNGAGDYIIIPNNSADAARTGMITEALAAGAYDMITPSLYDVIIKTKNARDEDSAEMINLIIRNRVFDPGFIYQTNGYNAIQMMLMNKKRDIASELTKTQKAAVNEMEKIVNAYLESNS